MTLGFRFAQKQLKHLLVISISLAFIGIALFPRCPLAEIRAVLPQFQDSLKEFLSPRCLVKGSINATLRLAAPSCGKNLEIFPGYYKVPFQNHRQSCTYFYQLFAFSNRLGLERTLGNREIAAWYLFHMMHHMATNVTSLTMVGQL